MNIFDKYFKKEEELKKVVSGGGGTAGAFYDEPKTPTPTIIPIPTMEDITKKETALTNIEDSFSQLDTSIETDYKQWQDYSKQLDDLELQLQEAPEELQFKLSLDYNKIQNLHNGLVDKIKANTSRYEQTKKEYDLVRDSYEKDVGIYNKAIETGNKQAFQKYKQLTGLPVPETSLGLPSGPMSKPEDKPLNAEQEWQKLMTTETDIDIKQIPNVIKNKTITDFLSWKEWAKDIPNLKWSKEEGGFRSATKGDPKLTAEKTKWDTLASQYGVNIDEWVPALANVTFGALLVANVASVAQDVLNKGVKVKPVMIPKEEVKKSFVNIMKSITPEGKISSKLSDNDLLIAQYFRKWAGQGGTPEALKYIMEQKGGLEIPQAVNIFGGKLYAGLPPEEIVKSIIEVGKVTSDMVKGLDPIKVSQVTQQLLNTSPALASAFLKAVEKPIEVPKVEKEETLSGLPALDEALLKKIDQNIPVDLKAEVSMGANLNNVAKVLKRNKDKIINVKVNAIKADIEGKGGIGLFGEKKTAKWIVDFKKAFGKNPTEAQLKEIATEQLTEGYAEIGGKVAPDIKFTKLEEALKEIEKSKKPVDKTLDMFAPKEELKAEGKEPITPEITKGEPSKTVSPAITETPKAIPQELEGLAEEAKSNTTIVKPLELPLKVEEAMKYESADKFIEAQGKPLYHGAKFDAVFDEFIESYGKDFKTRGIHFTDNIEIARAFTGEGEWENIKEAYLNIKNPLVIDAKGKHWHSLEFEGKKIDADDLAGIARARGNDGVIVKNIEEVFMLNTANTYIALNPSQIKTKQQLTDFYTQATAGVKAVGGEVTTEKTSLGKTPITEVKPAPVKEDFTALNTTPQNKELFFEKYNKVYEEINKGYEQLINERIVELKEEGFKGVTRGGVKTDEEGYITGVNPTVSNNPQWYRDFYADNGKAPTNKDLRDIAIQQLTQGHLEDYGDIPADNLAITYEAQLDILETVLGDIKKGDYSFDKPANITKLNDKLKQLGIENKKVIDKLKVEVEALKADKIKRINDLNKVNDLLQKKMESELRGEKEKGKEAVKITRDDLIAKFKSSQENIKNIKNDLIKYIDENLPTEAKGKLIHPLTMDNLTRKKAASIFSRVDRIKEDINKKALVSDIKKLVIPKGSLAVDYQKVITTFTKDIDFVKPTQKTLNKLKGLQNYIQKNGIPLNIQAKYLDKLKRLTKKPIREFSKDDLIELKDTLTQLQKLGKLKQTLKYKYNARERKVALDKLIASTKNIDPKVSGNHSKIDTYKVGTKEVYMDTLHTPRVADMIDGFKGYKGENARYIKQLGVKETEAKETTRAITVSALEEIQKLGIKELTEEQQINIMINIRYREGAFDQVKTLMVNNKLKEIPELTERENKIIEVIKKYTNQYTDDIVAVYEEIENTPFNKLKEYILPLKYEKEFNLIPSQTIEQDRYRTTQTFKGFSYERQKGVEKTPRTDILGIFEEAINEQQWYIKMQPELENIKYLVKSEEYMAKGGQMAVNWWKDELDIVSRRGWSATARSSPILRQARINLNQAILGYKISSILMQPFAVFDAMAYSQSRYGTMATLQILKEFSKAWIIPKYAKNIISESPVLQQRQAGELAIEETLKKVGKTKGLWNSFVRGAMGLIQKADIITAAGVQKGMEDILTKQNIPNTKQEAEFLMNLVSGSNEIVYRPHILAKGEGARTWFTFQTFFLNRWGILIHDLIQSGVLRGGGEAGWKRLWKTLTALIGLGIFIAGSIAEDEARKVIYEKTTGKELPDESTLKTAVMFIPEQIPYFGNLIEAADRGGDANPPVIRTAENFFIGGASVIKGKTTGTKIKGALRMTEAGLTLGVGVPGTAQAFDLLERIFKEAKETTEAAELGSFNKYSTTKDKNVWDKYTPKKESVFSKYD